MKRTPRFLLLAWAASAALPCFGESPAVAISQDALIQEIRHRHLTRTNGGIKAVVRIASGQAIELKLSHLDDVPGLKTSSRAFKPSSADSLGGLNPHPGLRLRQPAAKKARPLRKAREQLRRVMEKQGWDAGAKAADDASSL